MQKDERYFYRIENSNGVGPYRSAPPCMNNPVWMLGNHGKHGDNIHPPIVDEVCADDLTRSFARHGVKLRDCKFGFTSLSQLQRWFAPGEIKKLMELGYRIKRVLGKSVINTSTQSLFIPRKYYRFKKYRV
jgi:hypothetical protein